MSFTCTRGFSITINPATTGTTDMNLDQAIYAASPSAGNFIWGVRGGYLYKCNPTTGAKISATRFAVPAFSDASIAYDDVNDKLFCSVWRDMSFANGGDTNYDIIVSKKLFRINPLTAAVETSAEINGEPLFPGYVSYDQQQLGPHRLIFYSGVLYCASSSNVHDTICAINPLTLAVTTNGDILDWNAGYWMDFCIQPAGSEPAQLWIPFPISEVRPLEFPSLTYTASNYYSYEATDYASPYNIIYGVCWCPTNGKIYGTCRKPTVVSFAPNTVGSPFALTNIATGDTNATPYRIAYNPYDGLIYVPGYKSNNVVVIDPATDACTIKTGFDSPFDVVFTPTKKFAVQHSDVGLLEIT